MRYLDLIGSEPYAWGLSLLYLGFTSYLAWLGHKRTSDIKSFAIGDGNMNPVVVGLTLAASLASTATFIINPGLVYKFGVSAFMHYGVSVLAGVTVALYLLSIGFRRVGAETRALTLPQWIGQRFNSKGLTLFFAIASLLSLTFVVLILGGVSIIMQSTLGLTNNEAVIFITVFVFGYIFVGGTYAHAYTNTMQAIIMVGVSLLIVGSGLHYFSGGFDSFLDKIRAVDPSLASVTNEASAGLFDSLFKVYVAGFVIGFAVVCQPHILSKALYVKDDQAVRRYLGVAVIVNVIFTTLLLVGLYVHVGGFTPPADHKAAMTTYVAGTFSKPIVAFISVALVAAGMSTLDGILVGMSSIAGNDLFLGLAGTTLLRGRTDVEKARIAHRASQIILVSMGVVSLVIALHPPQYLGFFGQLGVYGMVVAACVPVTFGVVSQDQSRAVTASVSVAAALSMAGHFFFYFGVGIENPGVSATLGVFLGVGTFLLQRTISVLTRRA